MKHLLGQGCWARESLSPRRSSPHCSPVSICSRSQSRAEYLSAENVSGMEGGQ